jgi:hypothetical protein
MTEEYPYLPGKDLKESGLLSRFLPPIPEDLLSLWLANRIPSGSLVFDPFGTSPILALQIARAGYRVVTCVNNPIARFLISLEANPPSKDELRAALAEMARCRVGEERLEIHLTNLYRTQCSQCGNPVIAEAFIWERDASAPISKIYECKHCGDSGEHPVVQSDIDLSSNFPTTSMHRMRLIERISTNEEKVRKNLADALSVYQPRALYALFTLINRLESLQVSSHIDNSIEPKRENCLIALVLFALDYGNNLWSHPSGRPRPKQLSSSPIFRENNLWFILEKAVNQLVRHDDPVEVSAYPELPGGMNGVCVFEGPLRNLNEEIRSTSSTSLDDIRAVISALPRHNQAYWTLSALWTGWIWGREILGDFKSVLLRRRYDWAWHCGALNNAFVSLEEILKMQTPILGLIPEAESGFIQSSVIAASQENYSLKGISLRVDKQFAQVHWEYARKSGQQISAPLIIKNQMEELIVTTGIEYLDQRSEPAAYISLHTNSLINLTKKEGISKGQRTSSAEEYTRIQRLIENSISYRHGFIRHGGSEKSFENSIFWHQDLNEPGYLLTDRVEAKIRQLIDDNPGMNYHDLDNLICRFFPGLMTPDFGFIDTCIKSYCNKDQLDLDKLEIREHDKPEQRKLELASIYLALLDLGTKLEFKTEGDHPLIWKTPDGIVYVFYVSATAEIGDIIFKNKYPPNKSVLVIPGARSNLLLYKFRKNFHLNQIIDQGWRFLKFRHLRHLLDSPTLNRQNLEFELDLDPLTETPAQLRLL